MFVSRSVSVSAASGEGIHSISGTFLPVAYNTDQTAIIGNDIHDFLQST